MLFWESMYEKVEFQKRSLTNHFLYSNWYLNFLKEGDWKLRKVLYFPFFWGEEEVGTGILGEATALEVAWDDNFLGTFWVLWKFFEVLFWQFALEKNIQMFTNFTKNSTASFWKISFIGILFMNIFETENKVKFESLLKILVFAGWFSKLSMTELTELNFSSNIFEILNALYFKWGLWIERT